MKPFPPYNIHHIHLDNSLTMPVIDAKEKGNYLVFWWKDIGLGQFFIEPGTQLSASEYYPQLVNAIRPAIAFYLLYTDIPDSNWDNWLINNHYEDFFGWMEILLAKYLVVKPPASVPVSVIICTRNRAAHLHQCLTTLKGLACLAEEIIVVDNAPTDDSTENTVKKFDGVKYVKEPKAGLDIARNTGILNTTLSVIAYVDDDVQIHPLWAYNVWKTFQNPAIFAMTGLVIAAELETEAQLIFEKHWSFNRGYADKIYDSEYYKSTLEGGPPVWEIGAGANMAFRKSVFEKTGMFNEMLDAGAAGCNGDSEMWFRVLAAGYTIHYNPRAVVYHEHRKDLKGLKKQIFYYMRGFTTAALIQQNLEPESGYNNRLKGLSRYYRSLVKRGFPFYRFQYRTLWNEINGVISGLAFFYKNQQRIFSASPKLTAEDNDNAPLVSVIIPCYNHAEYLLNALESIRQQDYKPIEIVVVDDGSTDDTKEVLKDINGVKYIYQENQGLSAARNTGIKNSCGKFLVFLDADDWLLPGSIGFNVSYLLWNDALAFVSGAYEKVFVENGESLEVSREVKDDHFLHLLKVNYIGMCATVMYRRWVFDHFLFDETLRACEDYDLYLKIARDFLVAHHQHKIAAYRIHNANMSHNTPVMLNSALQVLEQQKGNLQTPAEERAFERGVNFFKEHYGALT
jgi:glycosyltransferase involved in cell wall biosynthesis